MTMAEKLSDVLEQELDKMASALTVMREERDAQARLVDCYRQEKEDLRRQLAAAQDDKERVVDLAVKMLAPGCDEYQAIVRGMSFDAFCESTRGKCLHCIEQERDAARDELAACKAKQCPPWLVELAERLRTQDNACTAHPVFTVQQRKRIAGIDTQWTDNVMWIEDTNECGPERSAELEAEWERTGEEPDECTRTGYVDEWEHVMTFFTNAAALDYIERNRHRLTDPRIYVDSAYRNPEWQQVVKFMLECGVETSEGSK